VAASITLLRREHQPKSRGAFGFCVISEEELIRLQQANRWTWLYRLGAAAIWLVILPLAGYGAWTLFASTVMWLVGVP
jgi:hypothetical protein